MRAALVTAALWCFLQIPLLLRKISLGSIINPHLFPSNTMAQMYSRDGLFVNVHLIWVHVALCRCVNGFLYMLVWAVTVRRTVHHKRTGSMKCMTILFVCVCVCSSSACAKLFISPLCEQNGLQSCKMQLLFKVVMHMCHKFSGH